MKYRYVVIMSTVIFSWCAAVQTTIEHNSYPSEEPYLFVSTIHHPVPLQSADRLAWALREFNHGVIIGLFQFRSNKEWRDKVPDWTARGEALLNAVDTDRLYEMVRDRRDAQKNTKLLHDEIISLQHALGFTLSHGCVLNCERALFQEEYREVNEQQEAFIPQLALRRAQGCAVAGRLIVAMKCLQEQCIVNCHLETTQTSFFSCAATDIWYYKQSSLCQAGPCEPKMLVTGLMVPDSLGEIVHNVLVKNVDLATKTLAFHAVVQQLMHNEINNPMVMGVDIEKVRKLIAQKSP